MKMKLAWLAALEALALSPGAMAGRVALAGGTLVDGTLSDPIRDSVVPRSSRSPCCSASTWWSSTASG